MNVVCCSHDRVFKGSYKFCLYYQEEEGEDYEDDYQPRTVGFSAMPDLDDEMEKKTPLRRRDTPHHKKGKRIVMTDEGKDRVLEILAQTAKKEDEEVYFNLDNLF